MDRELISLSRTASGRALDSKANPRFRRCLLLSALLFCAAAVGGCTTDDTSSGKKITAQTVVDAKLPTAQIQTNDECANRLHDICEPLLLYYIRQHKLPGRLEDLRQLPGFEKLELVCPVSKLPYVYNPVGIVTMDNQPRLICYDAAPSHSGMRWAISIVEPRDNSGTLIAKVVAVAESNFTLKLPR
jgi:hypothetical protein